MSFMIFETQQMKHQPLLFFSFFSARFSFRLFAGVFLTSFFVSIDFAITREILRLILNWVPLETEHKDNMQKPQKIAGAKKKLTSIDWEENLTKILSSASNFWICYPKSYWNWTCSSFRKLLHKNLELLNEVAGYFFW